MSNPLRLAFASLFLVPNLSAQSRVSGPLPEGPTLQGLSAVQTGQPVELARLYDGSLSGGASLGSAGAESLPALHAAPESGSVFRDGVDYQKKLSEMTRLSFRTRLSSLSPEQRRLVPILAKAAPYVNSIFRKQASGPYGDEVLARLKRSRDPRAKAARELFERNQSPYDSRDEEAALFDVPAKPKAGFQYPPDMTKEAFDAYIAEHPEQKAELYSPYSNVEWGPDGRLAAVPFHEAYKDDVQALASILRRAAKAATTPELKDFLQSKAEGLLDDSYEDSYAKWISLHDAPIDLVIGPTETYEDKVTSAKETYDFALYVKDEKGSAYLNLLKSRLPDMVKDLPVAPEFNPYLKDPSFKSAGNLVPVNLVAAGGATNALPAAGWTLPNEPEIIARHGTKMLLIRNIIETRGADSMAFIMRELFGESYDPEFFYKFVSNHELSHAVLPMTVGLEPNGKPLNEVLGDLTMPVEEQKADLLGFHWLEGLVRHGDVSRETYMDVAKMYVADMIYTTFRDPNEAHAKFQVVAYNLLKEGGAIVFDEKTGKLSVTDKFPEAMREVTRVFLTIQAKGDRAEADRLLKEKGQRPAEIAGILDLLNRQGIPRRTSYTLTLGK